MRECRKGNNEILRTTFFKRNSEQTAQNWGGYCPSLDAGVKVKILAEIEKQGDLSYNGGSDLPKLKETR